MLYNLINQMPALLFRRDYAIVFTIRDTLPAISYVCLMKRIFFLLFLLAHAWLASADCRQLLINASEEIYLSGTQAHFTLVVSHLEAGETVEYNINGVKLDGNVYTPFLSGMGIRHINAYAYIRKSNQKTETLKQTLAFFVMMPSAHINGPVNNILYAGVKQSVYIDIPGVAPNNTIIDVEGGKLLSGAQNARFVLPDSGIRKLTVLVSARFPDGSIKRLGAQSFMVLKLPEPRIAFNSSDLRLYAPDSLICLREPALGSLNLQYRITGYTLGFIRNGIYSEFEVNGNRLSAALKAEMQKLKKGDMVLVKAARVELPGIAEYTLQGTCFTINN